MLYVCIYFFSCSFHYTLFCILSVLTMICYWDFSFWSFLFTVHGNFCISIGYFFPQFGTFYSVIIFICCKETLFDEGRQPHFSGVKQGLACTKESYQFNRVLVIDSTIHDLISLGKLVRFLVPQVPCTRKNFPSVEWVLSTNRQFLGYHQYVVFSAQLGIS